MNLLKIGALAALMAGTLACTAPRRAVPLGGAGGQRATYQDPNATAPGGGGIGLESADFNQIADQMTRSVIAGAVFEAGSRPLIGVSVADVDFGGTTLQNLDPGLFVDQIRVSLAQHAMNRMRFLDMDATQSVDALRAEREAGAAHGTQGLPQVKSPDYFLRGKLREQLITDPRTGAKTRFLTVTMGLLDLGRELVWTDQFKFKKSGRDDLIYN